jgi:restriction system protein
VAEDTLYQVLNVPEEATLEEIRAAYRRLSKRLHPDQDGSEALFRRVQEAYEVLSDRQRRAEYDRSLRSPRPPPDADAGSQDENPAWVRVDDPGTPGARTTTPGNDTRRSGPDQWPPPRSEQSSGGVDVPAHADGEAGLPTAFRRHPAGVIAGAGAVLILLGGLLRSPGSLSSLGFLVLLLGLLAMIGSRRASMRYGALDFKTVSVDQLSGTQFEMLLQSLFMHAGYRVTRVGARGDFGADLLLDGPTGRTVVQAKRWSRPVGSAAVQEAVAAKAHYGANAAMVVSTSTFTAHAQTLARSNRVVLWDRTILRRELARMPDARRSQSWSFFFSALGTGIAVVAGGLLSVLSLSATSSRRRSHRRPAGRRPTRRRR